MMIWFILLFIISQIVIEKELLPKKLLQFGLLKTMFLAFLAILSGIVVGILINQPIMIVGSVTIFCSSMIAWKYRNKFENSGV